MAKGLIEHIAEEFKHFPYRVLRIENNDKFLFRSDVIKELKLHGIEVIAGTSISQRIKYELRDANTQLVLLSHDNNNYLEDIKQASYSFEFFLDQYLNGYHVSSIIDLDLNLLDDLFTAKQIIPLNKKMTLLEIEKIVSKISSLKIKVFDLAIFKVDKDKLMNAAIIDWNKISRLISNGILNSIGTNQFDEVLNQVVIINDHFQSELQKTYKQLKNSSYTKKPKIVSKILDYIAFNFKDDKIALIVIDGLALWQYELLRQKIANIKYEDVIYSWIPSITQLSRQAIFRGDTPEVGYKQNPINEEKIWRGYWKRKGLSDHQVKYAHKKVNLDNLTSVTKYGIVFTELDEKMHSSTDLKDLLKLTENWIERSKIRLIIKHLTEAGFRIFLTSDHGNIQAKGWRGLNGREKLGTNKSGSRSERHIEYSDKWLSNEFMINNPELKDLVLMDEQAIYFKSDLSFSSKDLLVTHGGAHILEVLIPFIEISDEK